MTELNDELLVAYVDGQLAEDQSKAIERVLEEDQVAAERVEALRAANGHLETVFEAMLAGDSVSGQIQEDQHNTASQEEAISAAAPPRRTLGRMVRNSVFAIWVGTGCFLGGGAVGYMLYDQITAEPFQNVVVTPPKPAPVRVVQIVAPPPATWEDDVARTHALLSPETFSFGLESEGNMDLAGFQISKTLGVGFSIPDLSGQNLTFHRAQMLQRDAKPFTQIAYLAGNNVPVALYAATHAAEPQALKLDEKNGIGLASWTHGGLSLLLAGNMPEARLEILAKAVQSQLAGAEPLVQDNGAPLIETGKPQQQPVPTAQ